MNKQLRKRHGIIWLFMAILIPPGILCSWLVIPELEPIRTVEQKVTEQLPVIKRSIERKTYTVNLRTDQPGAKLQLELVNEVPLTIPTAVIYQLKSNGQQQLIGRIEARGTYRFPLQRDSIIATQLQLQVYDYIHQQVIDTLNFHL